MKSRVKTPPVNGVVLATGAEAKVERNKGEGDKQSGNKQSHSLDKIKLPPAWPIQVKSESNTQDRLGPL